jgi:hypothetical protein
MMEGREEEKGERRREKGGEGRREKKGEGRTEEMRELRGEEQTGEGRRKGGLRTVRTYSVKYEPRGCSPVHCRQKPKLCPALISFVGYWLLRGFAASLMRMRGMEKGERSC